LTFHRIRPLLVAPLCLRQIIEQLTGLRIGGARRRALLETTTVDFRRLRLAPDYIGAQTPGSTERLALTGRRRGLNRIQHAMPRDRVVERGAEMRCLAIVASET